MKTVNRVKRDGTVRIQQGSLVLHILTYKKLFLDLFILKSVLLFLKKHTDYFFTGNNSSIHNIQIFNCYYQDLLLIILSFISFKLHPLLSTEVLTAPSHGI